MTEVIKHKFLNKEKLHEIINIKKLSWDYSDDQHIEWMKHNIKDNDYHFMLFDESELIGYMNLVEVHINDSNINIPFYGIGNVCSKYKGRGDGKKIMIEVNDFLDRNSYNGILFCKEHLVDFYLKFGWKIIDNLYPNENVFTMIYNYNGDTSNFVYNDRLF